MLCPNDARKERGSQPSGIAPHPAAWPASRRKAGSMFEMPLLRINKRLLATINRTQSTEARRRQQAGVPAHLHACFLQIQV